MKQDVFTYRLSLSGRPVGTQTLTTQRQGRLSILGAKLMLQGAFGNATVTQTSRYHEENEVSLNFSEETQERSGKRSFDVVFDDKSGLVKASKGSDKSEIPLAQPYLDPLSLLHRLRQGFEGDSLKVPMLGKNVTIERLGERELESPLGTHQTQLYALRPGRNVVYVDKAKPHHILLMTQIVDAQQLDAQLVQVAVEDAPTPKRDNRKRKSRRRRRRRRSGSGGGNRS